MNCHCYKHFLHILIIHEHNTTIIQCKLSPRMKVLKTDVASYCVAYKYSGKKFDYLTMKVRHKLFFIAIV
jgi:hypothetical protein